MPRPLLWQAASCPHSPPPPPPQQNCDRHRAWGAGRHSPTPWCTEVPRDTVGTWESCAPRDKLAGRGPHTPSLLSALLSTRRSHAHGVGTQGVRARLVLLEVTSRVRQATQSRHCHVQEMNSTLPQPPCLGALCFSSSPSPRLSYALHGSPHGSQAPSSPQPLAGTRTPLGPPIEGNPLQASDSPPTAHALPISLVVPLKPPSLWAPASPAGLRVSPPLEASSP